MSRCFFKIFGDSYWRELKKNSVTTIIHFLQLILIWVWNINETYVRSSHRRCSVRKGIFRNFVKFTGIRPATLLKKRLWHRCFPVSCEFYEISKNTFFTEQLWVTPSNTFSLWNLKFSVYSYQKVWFSFARIMIKNIHWQNLSKISKCGIGEISSQRLTTSSCI